MAEVYKFFNSTLEDRRRYKASDMADYWQSFLSTGLISRDKVPLLQVTANGENNKITVGTGSAIIKGRLYTNNDELDKEIPLTEGKEGRIDRVVLRFDNTIEHRYIKVFVKEGTETDPPELTRTDDVYELSLAQVHSPGGVTYITQDDVTDERLDEDLCGMASSLVSIPTEIFGEQWRVFVDEYYTWFESIKNEMYATEKEVRQRDHALKREIAHLEMMSEADRRIKNGVIFADNFKGNPYNIEYLKGKAELAEDVEPNNRSLKIRHIHDLREDAKEITIYDQEKQERLQIDRIEEDTIHLSKPIVNGFGAQSMLFESVHQIEDGYMKVGEVPSGMTIELNNIDLGDIYDEWFIYEDHFYMRKGNEVFYYDVTRGTKRRIKTIQTGFTNTKGIIALKSGIVAVDYIDPTSGRFIMYVNGENVSTLKFDTIGSNTGFAASNQRYDHTLYNSAKDNESYYQISELAFREGSLVSRILKKNNSVYWTPLSRPVTVIDEETFIVYGRDGVYNTSLEGNGKTIASLVGGNNIITPVNSNNDVSSFLVLDNRSITFKVDGRSVGSVLNTTDTSYIVFDDGYYTYLIFKDFYFKWAFNEIEKVDETFDTSNIIAPYLFDEIKATPFQLLDGRYAIGRFFEGVMFEPKEADIRFKVPKTKEVVSYIENNGLGEYSGWFNQHSTADASMENEIQMIGTSSDDYDTFRLTVKRESVDEDTRITRIVGGVL